MARVRTTPVVKSMIAKDTLDSFTVSIQYNPDLSVDFGNTKLSYRVTARDEINQIVHTKGSEIVWDDIPAIDKDRLREIHKRIMQHAENVGIVGAGVDSNDI